MIEKPEGITRNNDKNNTVHLIIVYLNSEIYYTFATKNDVNFGYGKYINHDIKKANIKPIALKETLNTTNGNFLIIFIANCDIQK